MRRQDDRGYPIYDKRTYQSLLLLILLGFMTYMWMQCSFYSILRAIALLLIPITYLCRISYMRYRKAPGLLLSDECITICYSGYCIPWTDITYINKSANYALLNTSYASIYVRDPWKHVAEIKNPVTRYFRWYTRNFRNTLFEVNLASLAGDDEENYHKILLYYQKYRGF